MKYSITINQLAWALNHDSGLDIVDLAIFDFVRSLMNSPTCESVVINGKSYYWIEPSLAIKEMPILGIATARGMNKRLDNLIEKGLLERCPTNQSTKKTYLCAGPKYDSYIFIETDSLGTVVPTPTWNGCSKNQNTNIDKKQSFSLEEKREIFRKKCEGYIPKYGPQMIEEFIRYWCEADEKGVMACEKAKAKKGTFEISGRLATWAGKDYNKPRGGYAPTPAPQRRKKELWEEIGFRSKEEYDKYLRENNPQNK